MMKIDNKFDIGQTVYLITDKEQEPRIITKIEVLPGNFLYYQLTCGTYASDHYEIEISPTEDTLTKVK